MTEQSILAASLATAGLTLLKCEESNPALLPPALAIAATSYRSDGDLLNGMSVDFDDPLILEKGNRGWYECSLKVGLFNEEREFLVAVERNEGNRWWVRVRLAAEWDIMGAGSAGVLGIRSCFPRFVMMSIDGKSIICGTDWENSIGFLLARDPHLSPRFREFVEKWAKGGTVNAGNRVAAQQWLAIGP